MEFKILGPLEVVGRDGVLFTPPHGRRATLLAALLVNCNHMVPAARLIEWLWGDDPPDGAAGTLQKHVSRLRATLMVDGRGERHLLTRGSGYQFEVPAAALDSFRFDGLVRAARDIVATDRESASSTLRQALSLWRGRALEGFDEEPFARLESVRLEELRVAAFEDLMELELVLGRHVTITPELRSLAAAHPTRERLTGQLMRALYHAGRQAEALESYQSLRQRLADDLGIEPSPELRQLERAVLRQEMGDPFGASSLPQSVHPGPVVGTVAAGRRPAPDRTPFVGREAERAELRSLMEKAVAGQGGLVMVGGEPGVGKSRLSLEVAEEGRRLGLRALIGHCYQRESDLPYMPWVEMVETVIAETAPSALLEALGDSAPEIARLVPRLRRTFPEIPAPFELPPDQQRRFTFTSLIDYVTRSARVHPRLYILEDLQWADDSTLLFLAHLADRLPTIPVLVLGTYRDPPLEVSPILEQTLAGLVRQRLTRLLSLQRHQLPEVDALLRGLSGQPPPRSVVTAIHAETEGNAFYVEEVYWHLAETGRLLDEQGRFRPDLRIDELEVPENVRMVTDERLNRISESTRRTLIVAAVIGRRFVFEVLAAASELKEEELLDAVDEAENARLLTADATSPGMYCFSHELIRQALLVRVSPPRRQRHHVRIADALELLHPDDAEVSAADIAHHLLQAGKSAEPRRTVHYLTLAGDRAQEAAAFEDALRHHTSALSILPRGDTAGRAQLLVKLGTAQRSLCRWAGAIATWEEALMALEAADDFEGVISLCWEYGLVLGWSIRFAEALVVVERGLRMAQNRSVAAWARLLALRATVYGFAGELERAATDLSEAVRLTREVGDARLSAAVSSMENMHHYLCMSLPKAVDAGRRAATALQESGAIWNLAETLGFLEVSYVLQGHFTESDEVSSELKSVVERVGHTGAAFTGRRSRFIKLAAQHGDLDALDEVAEEQVTATEGMEGGVWLAQAHTLRGIVHFWQGDWNLAREEMANGTRTRLPGYLFPLGHAYLFMLLAFSGDRTVGMTLLEEIGGSLPAAGRRNAIGAWGSVSLVAEGAGVLADQTLARRVYPLVVEALATGTLLRPYDGRLLQTTAAVAAAAADLREQAEEHFETAMRQAEELPHVMERPHVRHFYARFLIDRAASGDLVIAATLLEEAICGYRGIGMRRHVAMAEQLLKRI